MYCFVERHQNFFEILVSFYFSYFLFKISFGVILSMCLDTMNDYFSIPYYIIFYHKYCFFAEIIVKYERNKRKGDE